MELGDILRLGLCKECASDWKQGRWKMPDFCKDGVAEKHADT
jgi:hypothetical protein